MSFPLDRRSLVKLAGSAGLATLSPTLLPRMSHAQSGRTDAIIGLIGEDSAGITPVWRSEVIGAQIACQLFDTLLRVEDYQTMELSPGLALEWAQEDDLTYVFKLREGVQFHAGYGEMTSEDAAWSVNIAIETVGRSAVRSYIDGAEARDKYTYAIKLLQPYSGFIPVFSHIHYSNIMCKAAYEEMGQEEYNRRGIGTGPFELEEWRRGVSLSLIKNQNYWDPARPKLDRLEFLPVPDPFVKLEKLKNGELDFIDGIDFRDLAAASEEPGITVVNAPGDNWDFVAFNLRGPEDSPLLKKEVRQAIGYAINRQELVDLVYYGYATPDDDPFVPGFPGDDPDPSFYPLEGDPDKAKELLTVAGYPDGFEVEMIGGTKPWLVNELEIIGGQLADVGITVNLQTLDLGTFNNRISKTFEFEMGNEDISLSGPDSDPTVYWFLHSQTSTYSGYNNPEVDRLLDSARSESDPAVRNELYHELMAIIFDENPMLYLAHTQQIYLHNSQLTGFRPGRTEFNIYWDEMSWGA